MNERTNEQMNERTNERMNERMNERTNEWTNERTNERTNEQTDERMNDLAISRVDPEKFWSSETIWEWVENERTLGTKELFYKLT
jgi:hypothetical protein